MTATTNLPATTATKAVDVSKSVNGDTRVSISKDTSELMSTVAITATGYTILELIHHGLISGYAVPWLISMGLSASAAMYFSWALIALGVVGVSYLIFKWFIQTKE